ncbi:MAG: Pnap_2097 family protein [Bryobacteraceae bacterium]|jgi:probable biosynthetic protein (TIGR04099 family)
MNALLPCTINATKELSMVCSMRLGMPQLALGGLSESWLLMECGHRHWTLLERMLGVEARGMHDDRGCRMYASFVAVHESGASLAHFQEADEIVLESRIAALTSKRALSSHFITGHGQVRIDMISAFVRKARPSDTDTEVLHGAEWNWPGIRPLRPMAEIDSSLPALDRQVRRGFDGVYMGLSLEPSGQSQAFVCRPCPAIDFNGVGLLYFARYIDFVDRAEWECMHTAASAHLVTVERRIFYFANLSPGDSVKIELVGGPASLGRMEHLSRVSRRSDGRQMALVYTRKYSTPS